MPLKFSDFQEGGPSLDDFQIAFNMGKAPNEKSARLAAASQTLLTGGERADYERTKQSILSPTSFSDFPEDYTRIENEIWRNFTEGSAPDILSDPTLDDDTRTNMLNVVFGRGPRVPLSSMNTLSYAAIHSDSGENESESAERVRYNFVKDIAQVNQNKRDRQIAINELELGKGGFLDKAVDFAEVMVPFAEWNYYNRMSNKLRDLGVPLEDKPTDMLGTLKERLFNAIKSLPEDKRAEFTEFLLNEVQESQTVLLPDGNDLVTLETLNRMLVDNDYSNVEKWIDNTSSILDVIGVGATLRGALRGGRVASKGSKGIKGLEREAKEFKARPPEDLGPVAREAEEFTKRPPENLSSLGAEASEFKGAQTPSLDDVFGKRSNAATRDELEREAKALSDATRSLVSPASPSQIVKDANPEVARNMHKEVLADDTGEAAQGLYGTSRTEALSKDLLPELEVEKGRLPNKVEMYPHNPENPRLARVRRAAGFPAATATEVGKLVSRLTKEAHDLVGMKPHPSSLVVATNKDGTISFTGRFGPTDGAFSTWKEATDRAKLAFRQYGLDERDFTPLVRKGDEWVPVEGKLPTEGDFSVGVKFNYNFKPGDLEVEDVYSYKAGLIGRTVSLMDSLVDNTTTRLHQGSLVQNIIPPEGIIDPIVVNSAFVAVDRSAQLRKEYVRLFNKIAQPYKKLPKERKAMFNSYLQEANLEGIPFDVTHLLSRGFTNKEIDLIRQWHKATDTMWYAANADLLKSLRSKGFKVFTKDDGTSLMGVPVKENNAYGLRLLDPSLNTVGKIDNELTRTLYEGGGEVLKFPSPVKIEGKWADGVISRNTTEGGYVRGFRENEAVLAYRESYYPVIYDAKYFIQKSVKDGDHSFLKTIGTARDQGELNAALKILREEDPEGVYSAITNKKLDNNLLSDDSWDFITSSRMSSQKFRGERLGDAGADFSSVGYGNLMDPLEAVERQIYSLSQRVAMRDVLTTSKERWVQNYGRYLDIPLDKWREKKFPTSFNDIKGLDGTPRRIVEDARNHYNYLHALENGYINTIDESYKAVINSLGNLFGELGVTSAERTAFKASGKSPTIGVKALGFKTALSLNPLRQSVIQRGQILLLASVNPKYFLTSLVKDTESINLVRMGLSKDPKYVKLLKEVTDAGILDSVDAHILLRDSALQLADKSSLQKLGNAANKPINFAQKIGFDAAERDNLLTAWLAFRDMAVKAGKDLTDQRVKNEIMAQARSFTGGMNRAGDMAYTHNTGAIITQFFSFRHKMLMLPLANKNLTGLQRAQVMATNVALFGIEASVLAYGYNFIKDALPEGLADTIEEGLMSVILNNALTVATGTNQALDWSDFAPAEAYGMGNLIAGMWSSSLSEIFANSPSGSLVAGENPRLHDALKTAVRWVNPFNNYYEDEELEIRFSDVVSGFANIASGYSAAFRAAYAFETGKKLSSFGNITDEDVTKTEAALSLFGIPTQDETKGRKAQELLYEGSKMGDRPFVEQDVRQWYAELKRFLGRRGETPRNEELQSRILQEGWRVFGQDRPAAFNIIQSLLERDAKDKDFLVLNGIINRMGFMTSEELDKIIRQLPEGDVRRTLENMVTVQRDTEDGN